MEAYKHIGHILQVQYVPSMADMGTTDQGATSADSSSLLAMKTWCGIAEIVCDIRKVHLHHRHHCWVCRDAVSSGSLSLQLLASATICAAKCAICIRRLYLDANPRSGARGAGGDLSAHHKVPSDTVGNSSDDDNFSVTALCLRSMHAEAWKG